LGISQSLKSVASDRPDPTGMSTSEAARKLKNVPTSSQDTRAKSAAGPVDRKCV